MTGREVAVTEESVRDDIRVGSLVSYKGDQLTWVQRPLKVGVIIRYDYYWNSYHVFCTNGYSYHCSHWELRVIA